MEDSIFYYSEDDGVTIRRIGKLAAETAESVRDTIADSQITGAGHGNSKPVRVIAVDMAELSRAMETSGAKAFEVGDTFRSASEASLRLGFKHPQVMQELSKARRNELIDVSKRLGITVKKAEEQRVKIHPSAKVRGVTFQYEEDYDPHSEGDVRT